MANLCNLLQGQSFQSIHFVLTRKTCRELSQITTQGKGKTCKEKMWKFLKELPLKEVQNIYMTAGIHPVQGKKL